MNKIKCLNCGNITEADESDLLAVEMACAVMCLPCGYCQPHELVREEPEDQEAREAKLAELLDEHLDYHWPDREGGTLVVDQAFSAVLGSFAEEDSDGNQIVRVVMSVDRIRKYYMDMFRESMRADNQDMDEDEFEDYLASEAQQWMDKNVYGSLPYMGPNQPLLVEEFYHDVD